MSNDMIEVGGREWTDEEALAVLAFVDGGGLGERPKALYQVSQVQGFGDHDDMAVPLTREHIKALRDWVLPWTEVVWDDVKAGEHYSGGIGPGYIRGSRDQSWSILNNHPCLAPRTCIVRRPRKRALTLSDLSHGDAFKPCGPVFTSEDTWHLSVLADGDRVIRCGGFVLLAGPFESDRVEVVE